MLLQLPDTYPGGRTKGLNRIWNNRFDPFHSRCTDTIENAGTAKPNR